VSVEEIDLPHGAQVADLLARVKLTPDADIGKLVLEERLKKSQVFIIPKKGALSLYVTGAVTKPDVIFVPEGLRFNQLKGYISLADDADIGIFQRRRRLVHDGETVHIPAKSEYFAKK
jgi:hypothetical protein